MTEGGAGEIHRGGQDRLHRLRGGIHRVDDRPDMVVQDPQLICCHRWMASRIEIETIPVQHVCDRPMGHPEEWHECRCRAKIQASDLV